MNQDVKDRISSGFQANITRVKSLVDVYDALTTPGPGRPSVQQTDVLRAAVVLLHAALEDLIRASSEELLPDTSPQVLTKIGFPDGAQKTKDKFTLGELHAHKGKTVDQVIRDAVQAYLQRSNYNSVSEISSALSRIGLEPRLLNPHQGTIESYMKRRHMIVHRADKSPMLAHGRGIPLTVHLPKGTVQEWLRAVEEVGQRIVAALP